MSKPSRYHGSVTQYSTEVVHLQEHETDGRWSSSTAQCHMSVHNAYHSYQYCKVEKFKFNHHKSGTICTERSKLLTKKSTVSKIILQKWKEKKRHPKLIKNWRKLLLVDLLYKKYWNTFFMLKEITQALTQKLWK